MNARFENCNTDLWKIVKITMKKKKSSKQSLVCPLIISLYPVVVVFKVGY